jgi:hypothetical protein
MILSAFFINMVGFGILGLKDLLTLLDCFDGEETGELQGVGQG